LGENKQCAKNSFTTHHNIPQCPLLCALGFGSLQALYSSITKGHTVSLQINILTDFFI